LEAVGELYPKDPGWEDLTGSELLAMNRYETTSMSV